MNKFIKPIFFLFLLFFFVKGHSQNLTFSELLNLSKMSYEDINEYLGNKDWRYITTYDGHEQNQKISTWAHNKKEEKASAWFTIILSNEVAYISKSIQYTTFNVKTFNSIKSKMKELGYKQEVSTLNNGDIVSLYTNKNVIIKLTSNPQNDEGVNRYMVYFENITFQNASKQTSLESKAKKKTEEKRIKDSTNAARRIIDSLNSLQPNVTSTLGVLVLRDKPSNISFVRMLIIPANTQVEILNENYGNYCLIKYEGKKGYATKVLLEKFQ